MSQKDRRRNTSGSKRNRKKKIKIGNDFWAAENWKFDSNGFLFKKIFETYASEIWFCSSRRVE
jgi:hypothetical protein